MFSRQLIRNSGIQGRRLLSSTKPVFNQQAKPATPKKAGFLRWTWRATLLSSATVLGYLTYKVYKETNPSKQIPQAPLKTNGNKKKTVVILGTGWGAVSTLKDLDTNQYNVVVVSPRNYFLFTPLLPSVPTGTIDVKSISDPIRSIAAQTPGEVKYYEAAARDVDPVKKEITIEHKSQRLHLGDAFTSDSSDPITTTLSYDYLVYAVGATVNTFGIQGIPEYASFLKEANDATAVRAKLFNAIEASRLLPEGSDERKRLLNVIVCGGGPTGVELAAEIKDFINHDLSKVIPGIQDEMTVSLVEALPNVLNMFDKKLIEYTQDTFKSMKIDLRTNTMVKKVDSKNVYASAKNADGSSSDVVLPYGTLVWAGGNTQRDITKNLSSKIIEQQTARRGLLVDDFLKLYGDDSIYALGDCTFTKNVPTAQVAHQQGHFLAAHLNKLAKIDDLEFLRNKEGTPTERVDTLSRRIIKMKQNLKPFVYEHQGSLAYIGDERAIADLTFGGWSSISWGGEFTFLFWKIAYVKMMMGTRNRILVTLDWCKSYLFGRDSSKE